MLTGAAGHDEAHRAESDGTCNDGLAQQRITNQCANGWSVARGRDRLRFSRTQLTKDERTERIHETDHDKGSGVLVLHPPRARGHGCLRSNKCGSDAAEQDIRDRSAGALCRHALGRDEAILHGKGGGGAEQQRPEAEEHEAGLRDRVGTHERRQDAYTRTRNEPSSPPRQTHDE